MAGQEFTQRNFRRISLLNWALSFPLLLFFAWPYLQLAQIFGADWYNSLPGALLFSFPLLSTILHGHVTISLGALHRDEYYQWLLKHRKSYGLGFSYLFVRTRFRLSLLITSILLLAVLFLL